MKTKLVLWGTDADDKRILVAIALNAPENKVDIWSFPEEVATETFYNRMINEWRMGRDVPFPNIFVQIERPLTVSDPVLPDDIKVERPDIVSRAQTEWHFVVLSAKLFTSYKDELEFIRDKVNNLGEFDGSLWEELKGFWEKVQSQIHDKNLFRDHARNLKDTTNELFTQLKTLRRSLDEQFKSVSRENAQEFMTHLQDIEERIGKDLGLQPIFEELKELQRKFRATRLSRDDKNKVWSKLDKAFKTVKEKRYGKGYEKNFSPLERLNRRYKGLLNAIEKMERSIKRDDQDIEFQQQKITESGGQLEEQIRQAKLNMIESRIQSKRDKLTEMLSTKTELENRLESEKRREEARKAKGEHEAQVKERETAVKEKIADEIKAAEANRDVDAEKLEKAAEAISDSRGKSRQKESLVGAIATTMGESLGDVADTIRAVADVVGDKIEEALDELRDGGGAGEEE